MPQPSRIEATPLAHTIACTSAEYLSAASWPLKAVPSPLFQRYHVAIPAPAN